MTQTTETLKQEIARLRKRRDELRTRLATIEADYRSGLAADAE